MATKGKAVNPVDMERINKILSSFDKNFRFCGHRFYEKIKKTYRFRNRDGEYEYFYLIGTDIGPRGEEDSGAIFGINAETMEVFSLETPYYKYYVNKSIEDFIKCMKYANQKMVGLDFFEMEDEERENVLSEIKEGIIKIDSKTFLDEENWWPDTFMECI